METIIPVLYLLVNLSRADRFEIQSRPMFSADPWVDETVLNAPDCGQAGIRLQRAILSWDRRDPDAELRVRGCRSGADCDAWIELPKIQVVTLPNGPWTATGGVGEAGKRLPVDGSGIPVIIPELP